MAAMFLVDRFDVEPKCVGILRGDPGQVTLFGLDGEGAAESLGDHAPVRPLGASSSGRWGSA